MSCEQTEHPWHWASADNEVLSRRPSAKIYLYNNIIGVVLSPDTELDPQLSHPAASGFVGCLSGVLFNSVSPLKVALQPPNSSPVLVSGALMWSSCSDGASAGRGGAESTRSLSGGSSSIRESAEISIFVFCHAVCTLFFWSFVGQSDSGVRGQPMVNAIRGDSALVGGRVEHFSLNISLFPFFTYFSVCENVVLLPEWRLNISNPESWIVNLLSWFPMPFSCPQVWSRR